MGTLTEPEILDCLIENARLASECADNLAVRSKKGRAYRELRDHLAKVEGACRQMAHWRGDGRWAALGMQMQEAHKRAGEWLRGVQHTVTNPDGSTKKVRRPIPMGQKHPLFVKLAELLRFLRLKAEELRTVATGVLGPILPVVPREERCVGAPVAVSLPLGMRKLNSGLIVPQGVMAA